MTTEGTENTETIPTFEDCQNYGITSGQEDNVVTFFTFNLQEEQCKTYATGLRECRFKVARQTVDYATITECQTSG